jgi:pimeloyl-ACP methyl ester carboxylesterase
MKTPLVLLPGLLSNERLWEHQARHLQDLALIQILPLSENTPQKMVRAILGAAPPKFALAGHSMGGWLSLEVMREAPSRVSKLCLINTTARDDSEEKRGQRQRLIQETSQFERLVDELVELFVFQPSVKPKVKRMFLEVGKEALICQEEAMLKRKECKSILSRIACPTLIIHAREDKVFSLKEHEELVHGIEGAKLAIVENSGHMSPMEVPSAITSLLRSFLVP